MSNIVFLECARQPYEDLNDPPENLAQIIENSGLPDIMLELEAKLSVMLSCIVELPNMGGAEIDRENVS